MGTAGNSSVNAKLVLLGDMGAGKSSLVIRFVRGQFIEFQESTIGAAFFAQTLTVGDTAVKFEIWDTAGQERYHSLAPMYYRGAAAAIIVYDMTSTESFEKAKNWVQELRKQGDIGNPNMVTALAGNKCDLEDKRKVQTEVTILLDKFPCGFPSLVSVLQEANTYAEENGLFFMETSARTAINSLFAFSFFATRIQCALFYNALLYSFVQPAKRLPQTQPAQQPAGVVLTNTSAERSQASSCCS
ncbi:hypothetical protein ZIOFF_075900 [Zingiber officinale]|uniref:Uncharacterized protein n=1 Tax=Zingiber officinale TaxID=94328 RepID=A0A8J5C0K7_ZINOF|nr:hypothetical protein ZIOFF_075900 [Zingiber officinale]